MAGSDEDRDRSRRLSAEDQGLSDTSRVLGGRTIGRSVTPCAICIVHMEDTRSVGFPV
jgi:hypothetical protein